MTSPGRQNASEYADKHTAGSNTVGESLSRLSRETRLQNQLIPQTGHSTIKPTARSNDSSEASARIDTKTTKTHLDSEAGLDHSAIKVKEEEPVASEILSSPKPMTSSVKSPHSTSPPPTDNDTSISSSPRSASPDVEIRPPAQRKSLAIDVSSPFTPEELQEAKDIVLDLLGWGVSPEYFLVAGISPEAIYRVFTDLNLRLPSNLEVTEDIKVLAYMLGPSPDITRSVD